jgi:hypothetical protein
VHTLATVFVFGLAHVSGPPHDPDTVKHPAEGVHDASQHSSPAPTAHAVVAGAQVQASHSPRSLQVSVQVAP